MSDMPENDRTSSEPCNGLENTSVGVGFNDLKMIAKNTECAQQSLNENSLAGCNVAPQEEQPTTSRPVSNNSGTSPSGGVKDPETAVSGGLHPVQMAIPKIRPILPDSSPDLVPVQVKSEPVDLFPSTSHIQGVIMIDSDDDDIHEPKSVEPSKVHTNAAETANENLGSSQNEVNDPQKEMKKTGKESQSSAHHTRMDSQQSMEDYDDSIPEEARKSTIQPDPVVSKPMFASGVGKSEPESQKSSTPKCGMHSPSGCQSEACSDGKGLVDKIELDTDEGVIQVELNKSITSIIDMLEDEDSCHSKDGEGKKKKVPTATLR